MDEKQAGETTAETVDQDATPDVASDGQEADELTSLRRQVQELKERADAEESQASDYMHRWQRVAADFANFRRRTEQEREDLVKYANQVLIGQVLTVLDNFDRAFTSIPKELRSLSWISGVDLIYQQLYGVLMQQGLEAVSPAQDERYDPQLHEAISYEPIDGKEDGAIVRVYQTGYRLHGRLLRPALVTVAQGGHAASAEVTTQDNAEPAGDGDASADDTDTVDEPPA